MTKKKMAQAQPSFNLRPRQTAVAAAQTAAEATRDAIQAADDNTDLVEKQLRDGGHYRNNNSFKDVRQVERALVHSIVEMQDAIARELEVPGLLECIDQSEATRVKLALNGLSADFQTFIADLAKVAERYKHCGDHATNQDEVFLAMSLAEEYTLFATRMNSVIQPTYTYLSVQIGVARTHHEAILQKEADRQAAEKNAAGATDPAVVTDVEARPV